MSGTGKLDGETYCDDCYRGQNTTILCPLHAEAEAMRGLLAGLMPLLGGWREAVALIEDHGPSEVEGKNMWAALDQIDRFRAAARPVLARIDGDAPDERGG